MLRATVIMNTFNEDKDLLSKAIESYLNQEGVDIQLIVSTVEGDWSVEYIKETYPSVDVVTLSKEKHPTKSPLGAYLQLNNALPYIKNDWMCYASSNDTAKPFKIKMEIELCLLHGKEVCYSAFDLVNPEGKYITTKYFHSYAPARHMVGNFVNDCSIISKRLVMKYLPYDLGMKNYAHWDSWLRMYKGEGNVFVYNPTPTWNYRQLDNSMHIVRRRSPEQLAQAEIDKNKMLDTHR